MKRIVAIVAGGDTSEYEVSLRSAQGIYSFIDKDRYQPYIVVMHGTDWYVAAMNAGKETLKLTVELPMLAGSEVDYYHDGKDGKTPTMEDAKVGKNGKFKLTLPTNGAAVLTGQAVNQ